MSMPVSRFRHNVRGAYSARMANYSLRDEIHDYWSARAEGFDLQPGHEVFSEREREAWHSLITNHLGAANGRRALDMACGTGVISHLMDDLGFATTGIDWSEAMLTKAREKAQSRNRDIRFVQGDAENTHQPPGSCDVIITRHLVWTLVDPLVAFRHWRALLKPDGVLLVVDGDFVNQTFAGRVLKTLQNALNLSGKTEQSVESVGHANILPQLYFKDGADVESVSKLLRIAGFSDLRHQTRLSEIHRAQSRYLGLIKYLMRRQQHRYAISAKTRPAAP